jgi:drug/metabolite transporter (DMT)-like permease
MQILKFTGINNYTNLLKNKINYIMYICIITTFVGGFITIVTLQDPDKKNFRWLIDFSVILNNKFGFNDVLGLSLMSLSMIFISIYNICIKLLTNKEKLNDSIIEIDKSKEIEETNIQIESNSQLSPPKKQEQLVSNEFIFIHHIILFTIFYSILGLIFEDWSYILNGNIIMYLIMLAYGLTSYLLGNVIYFLAISFSSTTTFSLFASVSLITNISIAGMFLPDEKISNLWTILGCVMIIISITIFTLIKLKIN